MRESVVEQALARAAAARAGWALKWVSPGNAGIPDRIVVLPHQAGRCPSCGARAAIGALELKAPGEAPRPLQERQMERLKGVGMPAGWAASPEAVLAWLDALQRGAL